MADEGVPLEVIIKSRMDAEGYNAAGKMMDKLGERAQNIGKGFQTTQTALDKVKASMGDITNLSSKLAVLSSVATGAMLLSANRYVQQAKLSEQTSRQWLGAQYELEKSMYRIGRAMTQAILPWMDKLVGLSKQAADFVEKNPGVVKAGVIMAGGAAGITGAIAAASSIASPVLALLTLLKLGKAGAAVTGAATAAGEYGVAGGLIGPAEAAVGAGAAGIGGLGIAGAVGIGGGIGLGAVGAGYALMHIGKDLAEKIGIPWEKTISGIGDAFDNLFKSSEGKKIANVVNTMINMNPGQLLAAGAGGLASFFTGNQQTGQQAAGAVGGLLGVQVPGMSTGGAAGPQNYQERTPLQAMATAYRSYLQSEEQANRSYNLTLYRANRDFNRQELYAVQDFNRQRMRSTRDFNRQELYALQDYNRQRFLATRDFNISLARSDADYRRGRARSEQDHQFELFQIALSGDAMSYWMSERQFNIDKQRQEEDYQINRGRQNEDFNRQQADNEVNFGIQRARAQEQFAISLADQDIDFGIQRARAKEQFALQLSDMEVNLKEERLARRQAFVNQIIPEVTEEKTLEQGLIAQFGGIAIDTFQQMVNDAVQLRDYYASGNAAPAGTGVKGSRQGGGYVNAGLYRMHPGEFVLTDQTVDVVERAAKTNSLTQSIVMSLLSGGGKGMTYNDHRVIATRVSAEDRQAIARDTRNTIRDLLR